MPQYPQPDLARSADLDAMANEFYAKGAAAGGHADDYIRITVYLAAEHVLSASVGTPPKAARIGLVVLGGAILVYGAVLLIAAPKPPV